MTSVRLPQPDGATELHTLADPREWRRPTAPFTSRTAYAAAHVVPRIHAENVPGAPMRADILLCGAMFGLRTYRHRWFELSNPMFPLLPEHPVHRVKTSTKKRRKCWDAGMNISVTGDVGIYVGSQAMGIDWMTGAELSQAIPPAYTEFIGGLLLEQVTASPSSAGRPS